MSEPGDGVGAGGDPSRDGDGPTAGRHGAPPRADSEQAEGLGSVGEEAAKLFGALSDWAREQPSPPTDTPAGTHAEPGAAAAGPGGPGVAAAFGAWADRAAEAARGVDEHLATGSAECTYCPICRTVHLVRATSPEVRAHLGAAASSLLQAAAGLLAARPPGSPGGAGGAGPGGRSPDSGGPERIDLDDPDPDDPPEGSTP